MTKIHYHCEMFCFNWIVNITFERALTRRMKPRCTVCIYTVQYAYVRNLLWADLVFHISFPIATVRKYIFRGYKIIQSLHHPDNI